MALARIKLALEGQKEEEGEEVAPPAGLRAKWEALMKSVAAEGKDGSVERSPATKLSAQTMNHAI